MLRCDLIIDACVAMCLKPGLCMGFCMCVADVDLALSRARCIFVFVWCVRASVRRVRARMLCLCFHVCCVRVRGVSVRCAEQGGWMVEDVWRRRSGVGTLRVGVGAVGMFEEGALGARTVHAHVARKVR